MNKSNIWAALLCGILLTPGLLLGACDNSTGGDDGLSAAQTVAEEFRVVWDHVLGKSIERAALGDEADVEEALEDWETLDGGAQAELAAEKTKLESLRAEISSLKSSVAALRTYLEGKPDNSAHNPYPVAYTGRAAPAAIYKALAGAGKYVSLDLSGSAVTGFVHDTEPGRALVVNLVLPDSLEEIEDGATLVSVFSGFANLRSVKASGLRRLGGVAFAYCSSLAEVSLPEAESIGRVAFYGCSSLTSISLPKAASIGASAFAQCSSLTTVKLPEVDSLGNYAFNGCARLTGAGITLPESITTIGTGTFANCRNLAGITLPSGVTAIGAYAFQNSGLVGITLPSGVASIGAYAFQNCAGLTSITLPSGVTSIATFTFEGCASLADITLPEVAAIGNFAFSGCASLTTISLPKAETLDMAAFAGCRNLTTANLPKAVSLGGTSIFQGCFSLTTVSLPEATTLGLYTFLDCSSLVTLDLPKVTFLGDYTFDNCAGLATITLGATPPAVENGTKIFYGAATTAKTITFKVPDVVVYTAAGSPWSDKMGLNTDVGDYWDGNTNTKGNLTVALAAIDG
jgi:hypothetical protein